MRHILQLRLLPWREHCRLIQHIEEQAFLQASLFAERNRFGEGLHAQTQQRIGYQFHGGPHAALPHVEDTFP